ncbi:hypothetical protein [Xenorhabdus szentirmaii]|uniref:Uncharacterized protein n=1 Tax=Xenorhabdus szentirmaii DSM 16338 TaxID=1427518 RepID=W1IUU4_9GAMM|nr:hypothetical protein [Xenorhabdus szentirmaii]PHM30622.1 hypothetical protein Xsze_04213 [Xenorhabdus szentirmaii DSM 16338]CDL80960.1 conserved exported hypothetical protein [Xenorhabdus szentirmaii DSM 16338]
MNKLTAFLYTALAVIALLFSAYHLGGKAVRKSMEIKRRKDEVERLKVTLDARSEVEHEVHSKSSIAVIDELRNDWMRK